MTGQVMEISRIKLEKQRKLGLDKGTRDALADYCRLHWPSNTAKMIARAYGLTTDEARGVVLGRSSLTTYDKIKKAGGWPVIFAVEAMVIGQGADQYLIELRASHHEQAKRLDALTGDLWPVATPRRPDPPDRDHTLDQRERSFRRRVG